MISYDILQTQIPAVPFVQKYEHVFAFESVIWLFLLSPTLICVQRQVHGEDQQYGQEVQLRGLHG